MVRTVSGECLLKKLGILDFYLLFSRLLMHHATDDGKPCTECERHCKWFLLLSLVATIDNLQILNPLEQLNQHTHEDNIERMRPIH